MSSGLMKFLGALLLIGSLGYVGIDAMFANNVRGFEPSKPTATKTQ